MANNNQIIIFRDYLFFKLSLDLNWTIKVVSGLTRVRGHQSRVGSWESEWRDRSRQQQSDDSTEVWMESTLESLGMTSESITGYIAFAFVWDRRSCVCSDTAFVSLIVPLIVHNNSSALFPTRFWFMKLFHLIISDYLCLQCTSLWLSISAWRA